MNRPHSQRKQTGIGMIEVLVSIVVVALGVLAMARLQTGMVRTNQSALLRSQAVLFVYDITDRMRADITGAQAGLYDRAFGDGVPGGADLPSTEVAEWLTRIGERLPDGDGAVVTNGNLVTVSIQWDDSRDVGNAGVPDVIFTSTQQLWAP